MHQCVMCTQIPVSRVWRKISAPPVLTFSLLPAPQPAH